MKLPGKGKSAKDWLPLTVTGEIFRDAIRELTEDVSGLKPGSTGGWLREWNKARAALYWSLSEEQHEEIEDICDRWNATGIPGAQKKKHASSLCAF